MHTNLDVLILSGIKVLVKKFVGTVIVLQSFGELREHEVIPKGRSMDVRH